MAGTLKQSQKKSRESDFRHSHALVIGIDHYGNGIRRLSTPVNDATRLARLLADEHGYQVRLLVEDVSKARLAAVLTEELPPEIGENDRLLFYFAGHGIALDGDDGPQGLLVPQDADPADRNTLLPMAELHGWLEALQCRHMLAILDCCFAGAFRWASTRHLNVAVLETIHKERYERFVRSPSWQVLTSAAYDQEALDLVGGQALGARGARDEGGRQHSPFALALYDALRGEGDLIPREQGDGLITATELYLYLRERVEIEMGVAIRHDQTPGLWPLNRHDRGEYVFRSPGHALNLPPAPELTDELNPWRGLKSYDQEHGELFFGREQEIQELAEMVAAQPFTAVLGASGTGKSSLVKAGLLPFLEACSQCTENDDAWLVLPPLRPGRTPLQRLHRLLRSEMAQQAAGITPVRLERDGGALADVVAAWRQENPGRKLLLVADQLEELVTLADEQARAKFLALLAEAIRHHPEAFRLIATLRTDFEPQFDADTPLAPLWPDARYVVPPLDQADLRTVIEGPASVRVLYFEPPELVDTLVTEVLQTPGGLPLLSFTLSEMYLHYLRSGRDNRALAQEDYDALGGVIGSLRNRANEEYGALPDDAHRETMRRVMLRMISVEGGELARRRVYRSELVYPTEAENERVQTILDRLVAARLLVTGEDEGQATIEPAHDALVLAWDRLLRWKQAADVYLPLQRRLSQAATEWDAAEGETQSGLLWDDDPRLPQLEETLWPTRSKQDGLHGRMRWARQVMLPDTETPAETQWLNGREVAFVQASVEARARFWRRLASSVSLFILILIAATLISLTLQQRAVAAEGDARAAEGTAVAEATNAAAAEETAVVEASRAVAAEGTAVVEANLRATEVISRTLAEEDAIEQANIAQTRQAEAEYQSRIAQAQAFAARAENAIERNDYEQAYLLSIQAVEATYDQDGTVVPGAETALYKALQLPFRRALVHPGEAADVTAMAISPEGDLILTGANDGSLFFWSNMGDLMSTLHDHEQPITSVRFSPNGSHFATTSYDRTVRLYDRDGRFISATGEQNDVVLDIAISPDHQRIVAVGTYSETVLYDAAGVALAALDAHDYWLSSASFSPDGQTILTAGCDVGAWNLPCSAGSVRLWDRDGTQLAVLEDRPGSVLSAEFDRNGRRILTVGCVAYEENDCVESSVHLLDQSGTLIQVLEGGVGLTESARFAPDNNHIIGVSIFGINLFDGGGNFTTTLREHTDYVRVGDFHPDGSLIVTAGDDEKMRLWDSQGGTLLTTIELPGPITRARLIPGGHHALTLMDEIAASGAWLWDTDGDLVTVLDDGLETVASVTYGLEDRLILVSGSKGPCGEDCVTGVTQLWTIDGDRLAVLEGMSELDVMSSMSRDGQRILTVSTSGPAQLWDATGELLRRLTAKSSGEWTRVVLKASFSPDGKRIVALECDEFDEDSQLCLQWVTAIWDRDGNLIATLEGENVTSFALDSEQNQIITSHTSGMLRFWSLEGQLLYQFVAHEEGVASVLFSAAQQHIFTSGDDQGYDRKTRIWDRNGQQLAELDGYFDVLDFSPDGPYLLVAGPREVLLWNIEEDTTSELVGHQDLVVSGAFSPDGNRIVTASADGTVLLWNRYGSLIGNLTSYSDVATGAHFSQDGFALLTSSYDGAVNAWRAYTNIDDMLQEAMNRLLTLLSNEECNRYFDDAACNNQ